VFATFQPKVIEAHRDAELVLLGNIDPELQLDVLRQVRKPALVAADTMNLWIETARDSLRSAIASVDLVLMNDAELRMFTEQPNLLRAARDVMALGPRMVVAKQGEYGAALFTTDSFFALPAYPLEEVIDPTGAGDSFAGGFLGYLDSIAGDEMSEQEVRRAMTYGSVMASFNVEQFGTERVQALTHGEINRRFEEFRLMTHLDAEPVDLRYAG
jgi:sugar/nucleoside kinase (ribokinase family)